jgi:molybdenum cofactor cytidylyltransferase
LTIGALILAAGQSRRYGSDKRLHPIKNEPMLLATVRQYQDVFDDLIVVLRASDAAAAELLESLKGDKPVRVVHAQDAALGMGHSLAAGTYAAEQAGWQYAVVALADMPHIAPRTLHLLKDQLLTSHPTILQPRYKTTPGHPVAFHADLFPDLINLQGDEGARSVIQNHARERVFMDVADEGVLLDIDRPQPST